MSTFYNIINFSFNNVFIVTGDKKKDVDAEEVLSALNIISNFQNDDHPLIEELERRILENEEEIEFLRQPDGKPKSE